ncbi:DUF2975 domain-containing protein [Emticicia sp. C21]|uniref:DUF2975 domain-containing protein n=1 Tax=Emticicia sp. C21 TaxID=2302915 RepID=UPI000E34A237|nr:DUF2975 domain-containing protein [Emticicia sp. C21]RFS16914.1 DUF2975 domain-containing protein [Emticicia sp. C21]
MKTRTQNILSTTRIIAFIVYIGASIHVGRVMVPFIMGFINENLWTDTGTGFDFLRNNHLLPYIGLMSFVIVIALIQVQIWNYLRSILDEIDLNTPFSEKVAKMIENLSYLILSLGILYIVADLYIGYLAKTIPELDRGYFKTAFQFLLAAGIIYVISQIFKRGVEIQEENDLTV